MSGSSGQGYLPVFFLAYGSAEAFHQGKKYAEPQNASSGPKK
jgi:hypothetical protein